MRPLYNETPATNSQRSALIQCQNRLPQTSFNWKFLVQQLNRLGQFFVNLAEISQEPEVAWRHDRQGYSYFEIYDPLTEKHHHFDSEENMRIWLDRLRYQSSDENL